MATYGGMPPVIAIGVKVLTTPISRLTPEVRLVLRVALLSDLAVVRFSKAVNVPLAGDAAYTSIGAGCPSFGGQRSVASARNKSNSSWSTSQASSRENATRAP